MELAAAELLTCPSRAGASNVTPAIDANVAASHHLMLRGPGWPWQEHETLRGLFGPDQFSTRLKRSLGFDVEDAIACSEARNPSQPRQPSTQQLRVFLSALSLPVGQPEGDWFQMAASVRQDPFIEFPGTGGLGGISWERASPRLT